MKISLLTLALCFLCLASFGQKKAVTETGETVILYDDGTWKSLEQKSSWTTTLDTIVCKKPASANFLVKSQKLNYGVWINTKKWKFQKETKTESDAEYKFQMLSEDAYAMVIPEKIQIPLAQLKELALQNAEKAAPDVKIVHEDMRRVNGVLLSCMQMEGTIQGIRFTYFSYYYSDANGSIQLISYTSQSLFDKYKAEMENFLNGFVILKK